MEQLALVALSETWKWIETSAPSEGLATTVAVVAGLIPGRMDDANWINTSHVQTKGGVEVLEKWIKTPTWGPPWLNPVKGILIITVLVLIYLSIEDPTNTDYIWA